MFRPGHPRRATLDAHAEACVRHAAVTTEVEIPFERFLRQLMRFDLIDQEFKRSRALTAADYFALTRGGKHINTQRQFIALRIARHVKGLHRRRVVMDHHGAIKLA